MTLIEYDEQERWLIENDGFGAAQIIARDVSRLDAATIIAALARSESTFHITEGHEDGCPEYVVGRCVLSRGRPPEELANIISAEYRRSRGD